MGKLQSKTIGKFIYNIDKQSLFFKFCQHNDTSNKVLLKTVKIIFTYVKNSMHTIKVLCKTQNLKKIGLKKHSQSLQKL